MPRSANKPMPLGRQLWEARRCARLTAKELARKRDCRQQLSTTSRERDRGGRTRTLLRLAKALGLKLRIPDLTALAKAAWAKRS